MLSYFLSQPRARTQLPPTQVLRDLNRLKNAAFTCMSGHLLSSEISSDVIKEMEALKLRKVDIVLFSTGCTMP